MLIANGLLEVGGLDDPVGQQRCALCQGFLIRLERHTTSSHDGPVTWPSLVGDTGGLLVALRAEGPNDVVRVQGDMDGTRR